VELSDGIEFDFNDLLVDPDADDPTRNILIEVTTEIDEDGDDSVRLHIQSFGFSSADLAYVLQIAALMCLEEAEEEEDDE
jgi:hypothetical protein